MLIVDISDWIIKIAQAEAILLLYECWLVTILTLSFRILTLISFFLGSWNTINIFSLPVLQLPFSFWGIRLAKLEIFAGKMVHPATWTDGCRYIRCSTLFVYYCFLLSHMYSLWYTCFYFAPSLIKLSIIHSNTIMYCISLNPSITFSLYTSYPCLFKSEGIVCKGYWKKLIFSTFNKLYMGL